MGERFPINRAYVDARREEMDALGKPEITAGFSVIAESLKGDVKEMKRAQVLPYDMDLSASMKAWHEELLGRGIFITNKETGAQNLVGYILPVNDAYLIFFNNGLVRKGEVTDSTQTGRFTPFTGSWELPQAADIYSQNDIVTDETAKSFLNSFTKSGLMLTLSNDRDEDIVELRETVNNVLNQVANTRVERKVIIEDFSGVFIGRMEDIVRQEGRKQEKQTPEVPPV